MFLNPKDESFDVFFKFCKCVQKEEEEVCITLIRSDLGGEFENDIFQLFCEKMEFFTIFQHQ